ncbi:MAG: hypothetical protein P8X86_01540 [Desulfofustis sp.]|jgi:hypothetical protein
MTTPTVDIDALVEDEWYAVRYSGEIPEVAYHGAVYHLTEARNGPQIELSGAQLSRLLGAVSQRYLEITLRDLLPENKRSGDYRGLKRSFVNWQRYLTFCERYGIDGTLHQETVGGALCNFLLHEADLVQIGEVQDELNCSFTELLRFVELLGLSPAVIPESVKNYFLGC